MASTFPAPSVEFFTLYPEAPPPSPASETVNGSLPHRAYQFCPPVLAGSGFGWYLYPPADFAVRWDGSETELAFFDGGEPVEWRSLSGGVDVFLRGGLERLGELSDERREQLKEMLPPDGIPIANADPRAMQNLELQFGLLVRTPPGWASLVRAAPNWPYAGYQVLDGIIETSWSRVLIPVVIRLTEPGRVVRFFRVLPAAVLQVVADSSYARETMNAAVIRRGIAAVPDDVWKEHVEIRSARFRHARPGNYRLEQHRHAVEASGGGAVDEALADG